MASARLLRGLGRDDAVDTVWTLMDPAIFCRLTEDRHWPPGQCQHWFTDTFTQLLLAARGASCEQDPGRSGC